jgi:hypothetical protein
VAEGVTQGTLDSLPVATVTDGRRICEADGRVSCPLATAVANWLDDDRFALWEPGRPMMVFSSRDTAHLEFGATDGDRHGPVIALAVAREGSGFQVLATGVSDRVMHFNNRGEFQKDLPLPRIAGVVSRGFTGETPVLQRMGGAKGDRLVHFELDVLKHADDTTGRAVVRMPLTWLHLQDDGLPEPAPFFPAWPSFGVDREGGIAWSPGDQFVIHRVDSRGLERWTINGNFAGPEITAQDMAAVRAEASRPGAAEAVSPEIVDSMAARTGKFLAAISGLILSRQGDVLVTGALSPARDSVVCYRISPAGKLLDQFRLPRHTKPLLFAGDSVLVHRPTESDPWEVLWLRLKSAVH